MTLSELLQKNNVTQAELARKVGVSEAAISRWNNKLRIPSIRYMDRLAKELHCSKQTILKFFYN